MKKGLLGRMKAAAGRIRESAGKVLHGTPEETAEERKMRTYGLRGLAIAAVALVVGLGSVAAVNAATTTHYARYYSLGGTYTYFNYDDAKLVTTTNSLSFSSTTTSTVWLPFYYTGTLTANNFHSWSSGKDRLGLTNTYGLVEISYSGHAFMGWYVCQGTAYGKKYQLPAGSAYRYATAVGESLEAAGGYSTVYDIGCSGMVAIADKTVAATMTLPSNNDYSDSTLTVEGFTMSAETAYGHGTGNYLSIYPMFAKNSSGTPYKVTYSLKGGSYDGDPKYSTSERSSTTASVVQQTFFYNIPGTILSFTPSKTGYTFEGWDTDSSADTVVYESGDSITITSDTTLYAVWTVKSRTVTFNNNGSTSTKKLTYGSGTNYSLTPPTRTGYTFNGWYTGENGTGTKVWNADGTGNTSSIYWSSSKTWASTQTTALTVYAYWTANTYTITFHKNGGSGTDKQTMDVTYGASAVKLTSVSSLGYTRTGYTFSGWATSSSSTTIKYKDKASVSNLTADLDLYAVWTVNTFTIKYNSNGGSGTMANTTVTYGTSTALRKNTFTRTGYTFAGWYAYRSYDGTYLYMSADGSEKEWYEKGSEPSGWTYAIYSDEQKVSKTAPSGTVTMYAVWEANVITVKYYANGGSGTTPDSTFTYGVSTPLSTNGFTRTGYTFVGWYAYRTVDSKYLYQSADGSTNDSGKTTGWYKAGNQPDGWVYYVYKSAQKVSATASSGTVYMYSLWSKDGAGWTMEDVIQDSYMFYKASSLVGGEGTAWDGGYIDSQRAKVDEGSEDPGYFTQDPY